MRIAAAITIGAIALYSVLGLLQLWFTIMDGEVFLKVSITFGVVVVASGLAALIGREYVKEEKDRKDGYID